MNDNEKGAQMARDTLAKGREEYLIEHPEKAKESVKTGRPWMLGKPHKKRCTVCNEKFHKEDLDDMGRCPDCESEDVPAGKTPVKKKIHYPVKTISAGRAANHEIPMKRCFFCEGTAFNIFQTGIIRCTQCGAEFCKK